MKAGKFFYGRYRKEVPFLSKMVYKRVRVWTSASPYKPWLTDPDSPHLRGNYEKVEYLFSRTWKFILYELSVATVYPGKKVQ